MSMVGDYAPSDRVSGPGAGLPSGTKQDNYQGAEGIDQAQQEVRPSKLPQERMLDVLKGWFRADATHSAEWRADALKMFNFRAGDQWDPEDRQILNAQSRPQIVFNRALTILKAVAGMEINGRHEVHFIPRHNEDTQVNELLSGASKWMGDECDAEDEESEAFQDTLTCGMGFLESRMDYEVEQKGLYQEERIYPLEMYWDRTARKKNLSDARRMHRAKKMPLGDAMQIFRGKTKEQLDATWAVGSEINYAEKTLEEKRKREQNTTDAAYDDLFEVTIVNVQWWEREAYWVIADPVTNSTAELSDDEYKLFSVAAKRANVHFVAANLTRRVFKEAYIGNEILSVGDAAIKVGFKWDVITGERNEGKGSWFGLCQIMLDPQRWANKWLSQSLHILNTTAKGGIVAEQEAFEDVREAEDKWARPDAIIWVKRGALSGDKPKIMPRPGGAFPEGHVQLMQFAITALRDVTGINLELLGLKDENQPGILEAQRKQAGMTVLATLFDSLRRMRKMNGRKRLFIIQNFLSDGRLIRIVGQEGAKALPLLKDKTEGEYNVVVDDAPTSPNQKEANWAIIASLLPAFKDQLVGNPELLVMVLEYSPLPAKLLDGLKQMLQKNAPQQQKQQSMQESALTAKINKDQAQAELYLQQAQKQQSTALYDIAIAMAQFTKASTESDHAAAETAHTKVKTAIAAMTPIDTGADPSVERHKATTDAFTKLASQAAAQAHERGSQLLDQAHQQQMQAVDHSQEQTTQAAQQQHEQQLAAMQPTGAGVG